MNEAHGSANHGAENIQSLAGFCVFYLQLRLDEKLEALQDAEVFSVNCYRVLHTSTIVVIYIVVRL